MRLHFLWLLLGISLPATAQTILIKDEASQKPIVGALIFDDAQQKQVITNERGEASLNIFKNEEFINIRMLGYQDNRITLLALQKQQYTLFLKENPLSLNEVIVSANRWEQNLREVANAVVTLDAATVKLQNPQTAGDLLSLSDRVFVQKSQLGGGSPMLRGFATNRVLLVIDGVRMNNAIYRSGNVQNVISLDANAIEETEVIFGPGSVMYGSDAIGGVMDFHTLTPRLSTTGSRVFKTNALVRYSSANKENTTHADVSIGLNKWAFTTSVTAASYDDLRMGNKGPVAYTRPDYVSRENNDDIVITNPDPNVQVGSGYNQLNVMQKIRFSPTPAWDINYAFHYSKSSDVPRYDRLILKNENGDLTQGDWYYGPQKWNMHVLRVDNNQPTTIADHMKVTAAYQQTEESRHSRSFGSVNRINRFEKVDALSLNLDFDKELTQHVSLFYGTEYVHNLLSSTAYRTHVNNGTISPASTRYPDGATWESAAVYLNVKMRLTPQLILTLGNRFSYIHSTASFDTTFFNLPTTRAVLTNRAVNSSLGLVYNPTIRWKFFTNFSSGFRAPNIDDIGKVFDSEPGNVVVPNPGLRAETAYSAEVGFATVLHECIKLDGAVYYSLLDNAIARGVFTLNGQDSIEYDGTLSQVQAQQNISKVSVYGIQAGIQWEIAKPIILSSTINYQKGKERDPKSNRNFSPAHVAPLFGATHVRYTKINFKADLYALYNGAIRYADLALSERADSHLYTEDVDGNPYAPSWFTLNIKTSYTFRNLLSLDLGLENILDKRYRPYSSGISAPGRNFIMSFRVNL